MSYHATIRLTKLEQYEYHWYFEYENGLYVTKFEQVLKLFEGKRFYECSKEGQGWLIKQDGLYFLAPHFTNYDEMLQQAREQRRKKKCHTCSNFHAWKTCECHDMPLCANCYNEHLKEAGKTQRATKVEFFLGQYQL